MIWQKNIWNIFQSKIGTERKQAQIYAETDRIEEAYKAYEELLFSDFQRASMELHGMYMLAIQDDDKKKSAYAGREAKGIGKMFLKWGNIMRFQAVLILQVLEKKMQTR